MFPHSYIAPLIDDRVNENLAIFIALTLDFGDKINKTDADKDEILNITPKIEIEFNIFTTI